MSIVYAHSVDGRPQSDWETLEDHAQAVAARAACFAGSFGGEDVAAMLGWVHDLGKMKPRFQAKLTGSWNAEPHSGEGAKLLLARCGGMGPLLAACVAGHHSGLPDIRSFTYNEHEVYRLDTYMRFITSIEFEAGENIESVQVGDSESWQIVRLERGDVLSVKPLIEGAYTNMTVYTNQRPYTFELRARPGQVGAPNLNYRVSFRYPEVEARQRNAAMERAGRPKDYNYFAAGDASAIKPVQVYDDGKRTIFVFSENSRRPAIFLVGPDGRESIVNVRHDDKASIVDRVSDRWTIRIGDEEICVAHGDVIRSVPGGRRAPQLAQGYGYDPETRRTVVTR